MAENKSMTIPGHENIISALAQSPVTGMAVLLLQAMTALSSYGNKSIDIEINQYPWKLHNRWP